MLRWQSTRVAAETIWSAKPQILPILPFTENVF